MLAPTMPTRSTFTPMAGQPDDLPAYLDWLVVCPEDLDEDGEFILFDPGLIPFAGVFAPAKSTGASHAPRR